MEMYRLLSTSEMPSPLLKYKNKKVEILFSCCVRNSKGKDIIWLGMITDWELKKSLRSKAFPNHLQKGAKRPQETCPTELLLLWSAERGATL